MYLCVESCLQQTELGKNVVNINTVCATYIQLKCFRAFIMSHQNARKKKIYNLCMIQMSN